MTTSTIQTNLQRLLEERSAYWDANGKPLAEIAQTRDFTEEERSQFEEVERTFAQHTERIRAVEAGIETERSLAGFNSSLDQQFQTAGEQRWYNRDTGESAALRTNQSFASHPVVQRATAGQPATERHENLGAMVRALATSGGGSALVPSVWSSQLIDLARANAAVTQAGATIVPMATKTVHIGRVTSDPTAAFRVEASEISASDPGLDSVTLTAKSMNALVIGSLEWFQDVENAESIVSDAIGKAMALQLDKVALYGGITSGAGSINLPLLDGSDPLNPRGILAGLNALKAGNVLGGATNGTTQTTGSYWDEVLDILFTVRDSNEEPGALIWNSKLARQYAKTYDTTGQPLGIPAEVERVQRFVSNSIPSYTKGTMSNVATDVFGGDFSQLLIGQRTSGITLQVLTERYADTGQVGIVATWRGDIQLARAGAFSVYKAIKGA